ncbi:MAG: hypothetical protein NXI04_27635 [Planctomycetaceae bacterium]|nr:hypothetical protein [Planctomycetaceae bacterium]
MSDCTMQPARVHPWASGVSLTPQTAFVDRLHECGARSDITAQQGAGQTMTNDALGNRLRPLFGPSINLKSDDEFQNWVLRRWDHFADQGPLTHLPTQSTHVDQPWPDNNMSVYVARYPGPTALNVVDFQIFTWYTSSIQQDLIRDGKADLQYFYPEDKSDGATRLISFVRSSEILANHDSIIDRLQGFRLPPNTAWVHDLEYNSAIVAAGADGIEMVADSDSGYLTIIALDG